jgi:hypothetical protein
LSSAILQLYLLSVQDVKNQIGNVNTLVFLHNFDEWLSNFPRLIIRFEENKAKD